MKGMRELDKKIGIRFQFEDYDKHFAKIFEDINIDKYDWYVTNSEIIYFNEKIKRADSEFLQPAIYKGKIFSEQIDLFPYYIIHARILAVPEGMSLHPEEIIDYDGFCNSSCEIALLCADCYVDLYAKRENIVNVIAKSCKKYYGNKLSFITEKDDGRTSFFIG
ncbi:MAG: DUF2691 family protein [Clostridia bacterium]|nr:DUF2691 family protein [Clostridia bacterium]